MHNALVHSISAYDSNVLSAIVRNLHHKAPYRLHTFTHIHLSHKRLCYAQIALWIPALVFILGFKIISNSSRRPAVHIPLLVQCCAVRSAQPLLVSYTRIKFHSDEHWNVLPMISSKRSNCVTLPSVPDKTTHVLFKSYTRVPHGCRINLNRYIVGVAYVGSFPSIDLWKKIMLCILIFFFSESVNRLNWLIYSLLNNIEY